jgi:hypothetical protein
LKVDIAGKKTHTTKQNVKAKRSEKDEKSLPDIREGGIKLRREDVVAIVIVV